MPKPNTQITPGQRYGQLIVLEFVGLPRPKRYAPMWKCQCDCGKILESVYAYNLRSGNTRSCGHDRHVNNRTHGKSKHREYNIYHQILDRCFNPDNGSYDRYGGRGIGVCESWRGKGGFENFYRHMGPRPSKKHTVERVNNDGGYGPDNCRWATKAEQNRNRRSNLIVEFQGKKMCLAELAERSPVSYGTLWFRIRTGWSVPDAMTTPVGRRR